MKYVSIPWPPIVAAHYRTRLAAVMHSKGLSGSRQTVSIPNIQLRPSESTNNTIY